THRAADPVKTGRITDTTSVPTFSSFTLSCGSCESSTSNRLYVQVGAMRKHCDVFRGVEGGILDLRLHTPLLCGPRRLVNPFAMNRRASCFRRGAMCLACIPQDLIDEIGQTFVAE